jgi:7-carboxy-7-deazaguanine synthase
VFGAGNIGSSMAYHVKEILYTIQGEGANTGKAAVFCRFSGCNLWSGLEGDRQSAICRFCDTDFVGIDGPGGGVFPTADSLAAAIASAWSGEKGRSCTPLVVCTGGEPLLQLDPPLLDAIHAAGFRIATETNGTLAPPPGIDWICVSPKAGTELLLRSGNELKLIHPQPGAEPEMYEHLEFDHFFLQPMDGRDREANAQLAIAYSLAHPRWRVSLQIHKILGIP